MSRRLNPLLFAATLALTIGACGSDAAIVVDATPINAADAATSGPLVVGGDRPAMVQVPPTITPGERYPLFLILHGYGATGSLQQTYFQLSQLASSTNVFVVAPDGTTDASERKFWNASGACCDFANTDVDDVAYLGGLLDEVIAGWPIDPSRVFVIGHSNGGFMAFRLACDRADIITGIADLAGANISVDGSGCSPTQPVNVLHLHGTADATVAYAGGNFGTGGDNYPGAVASATQWAGFDGCAATSTIGAPKDLMASVAGDDTVVANFDACPAGGAVSLWTLTGGSHIPNFVSGVGTALVDWLTSHPRP